MPASQDKSLCRLELFFISLFFIIKSFNNKLSAPLILQVILMKIHTRLKRKYALTTSQRHTHFFKGVVSLKKRQRTFRTEEGAKAWAEREGLKDYKVVPAKKDRKFKIERL